MTHRSKFLKSRVEKKLVNQYGDGWCYGCGEDHGKETRAESARRRRIDSEMRRVRRREHRQSPFLRWFDREMNETYQLELYAAVERFLVDSATLSFPLASYPQPTDRTAQKKKFEESEELLGGDLALSLLEESRKRRIEMSMRYGKDVL